MSFCKFTTLFEGTKLFKYVSFLWFIAFSYLLISLHVIGLFLRRVLSPVMCGHKRT